MSLTSSVQNIMRHFLDFIHIAQILGEIKRTSRVSLPAPSGDPQPAKSIHMRNLAHFPLTNSAILFGSYPLPVRNYSDAPWNSRQTSTATGRRNDGLLCGRGRVYPRLMVKRVRVGGDKPRPYERLLWFIQPWRSSAIFNA